MAWHVRQRGETVGPVDEATVERWILDGMHDAEVRDDAGGDFVPIERSRFAPLVAGRQRQDSTAGRLQLCVAGAAVVAVLSLLAILWIAFHRASEGRVRTDVNSASSSPR